VFAVSRENHDPLVEWNRLNVSNAEQSLIEAFYLSTIAGSESVDRYSSWLLAGIGATAALMVSGVSSIVPFLTQQGFKYSLVILVAAGLAGMLAKLRALQVRVFLNARSSVHELFPPIISAHLEAEEAIKAHAQERSLVLPTEIDINRVAESVFSAFPRFMRSSLKRRLQEGIADRTSSSKRAVRDFVYQTGFTMLQSILFLAFVLYSAVRVAAG
jgi:hypothetical protein